MCGRYALGLQHAQIRGLPGYPNINIGEWVGQDDFVPRYNIAPNTNAPVIRQHPAGAHAHAESDKAKEKEPASTPLIMQTMRWGVHYGKESAKGSQAINARSENLVEGIGMWNKLRGKNRCVVVCQGYYEWQTKGKEKLPHFTKHPDGRVMLMAGLYDETIEKGQSQPSYTFAIVTTDASKALRWLHDRQPVIFSTMDEVRQWLDTSSLAWSSDLARLLHPWEDTATPFQCYQVPTEVGKVGTESPRFMEPIASRKDGIMAMFAKQRSKQVESSTKRERSPTSISLPSTSDATKKEEPEEKKVKIE